jgi:hypothetical protein
MARYEELERDPFREREGLLTRTGMQLLGGRFTFRSNSEALLALVDAAFAGVPKHRFTSKSPRFEVRLNLAAPSTRGSARHPPPLAMLSATDMLAGAPRNSNFAVLSPSRGTALVSVSQEMLAFPYHTRYELIEFTVYTLASRGQGLVPLHAACVGINGRGVLLMGESGAGKSTLSLQCLLEGFEFLAEDSIFVSAGRMLASGVANFLHVRTDSLGWLERKSDAAMIRKSPVIERRSGVEKFELNLRRTPFQLAGKPLKLVGVIFLSPRSAGTGSLLRRLPKRDAVARLNNEQGYGRTLPHWREFQRRLVAMGAYELQRGAHPRDGAKALREVLAPS